MRRTRDEHSNEDGKTVMTIGKKHKITIEHWRMISLYLVIYDILAVNFAYFFGLWLRFDLRFSQIPSEYLSAWGEFTPIYTVLCLVIFYMTQLYRSIWRYASFDELNKICIASVATTVVHIVGITVFYKRMPISYYLIGTVIQFALLVMVRFSYRFITLERARVARKSRQLKNTMIIGAGAAGRYIIRELKNSEESHFEACCVIDDNANKWNRFLEGVPVVGGRESIMEMVEKYEIEEILFAIPTAKMSDRRDILSICNETGCEVRSLPGMYQLANGEVAVSKMRPVSVEDLLGRDPVKVNMTEIFEALQGKTILVTGGGGSIGSELCRQIAAHNPKRLIIFDVYENNAYDIQLELKRKYPNLQLETIIGSVRDSRKIFQVFETYRPDVVYHAAAHKHVPLMEDSPCEAIKNNAIGTYKTAYAAMVYGCKRFVLISTDKAVNPTNIMGASKRLCEMVIQSFDQKVKEGKAQDIPQLFTHSVVNTKIHNPQAQENLKHAKTEFVAVRFGNVLGSNGSVIPLFRKQIAQGGPVTVTHPDIIRYFMTIPEAVSLVLQASMYAHGGEIFVLDMGEPVKIDTLARNLIRLSGYKPDVDIKVEYTGLRPGEKLYEEKLMAEEGLKRTENELIHIGCPIPFDTDEFLDELEGLMCVAYKNKENIREYVAKIVTTYHPAENSVGEVDEEETVGEQKKVVGL